MAAPTYGAAGTHVTGTGSTVSFPVPAGMASDQIVVIPIYLDGGSSITVMAAGFDHATGSPVSVPPGAGQHSLAVVWKRASGTDTGTYDFTLSGSTFRAGSAHSIIGCAVSGNPWDVTDTGVNTTNNTTTADVDVTTTGNDRLLVFAATNWASGAWTPPTGFDERMDTGDRVHTMDTKAQAAAGSTGTVTATCTGNDKGTAFLGALKPVPTVVGAAGADLSTLSALAVGVRTIVGSAATSLGVLMATAITGQPAGSPAPSRASTPLSVFTSQTNEGPV